MNTKQLKIIHTPVRFYPYTGGVEYVALNLASEQVKQGHSVKVICANEPNSSIKTYKGISIDRLSYIFKVTNTNITLFLPFKLLLEDYDVMQTYLPTPWSADISILITKLKSKRSILYVQNDLDKAGKIAHLISNIYLNTVFKLSLHLVDKIIIVNPNWREAFSNTKKLLKKHENKITEIPNGVDLTIFKPNNSKKKKKNILFVSILDEHHLFKGFDYLLEAMAIINAQDPEITLTVVGEGKLKDVYIKKTEDLKLTNIIEFVGEKNQVELVDYYNQATLFVLPSIDIEGFGMVLVESLACGTPVITTKMAGIADEVLKNNVGVIVPTKDEKSLAREILTLISKEKILKTMRENGIKLVKSKYTWELIASKVSMVYAMT